MTTRIAEHTKEPWPMLHAKYTWWQIIRADYDRARACVNELAGKPEGYVKQLEARNAELMLALEQFIDHVIATDRTPEYGYGTAKRNLNNRCEYAGAGSRWITPIDMARQLRDRLAKQARV